MGVTKVDLLKWVRTPHFSYVTKAVNVMGSAARGTLLVAATYSSPFDAPHGVVWIICLVSHLRLL